MKSLSQHIQESLDSKNFDLLEGKHSEEMLKAAISYEKKGYAKELFDRIVVVEEPDGFNNATKMNKLIGESEITEGYMYSKALKIHKSDKERVQEIVAALDDPSSIYDGPQAYYYELDDQYLEIGFKNNSDYEEIYKAIKTA